MADKTGNVNISGTQDSGSVADMHRLHACFTGVLILLFALDIITTMTIISAGGTEINPFFVWAKTDVVLHVLLKLAVASYVILVTAMCDRIVRFSGTLALGVLCVFYTCVVFFNVATLFRILLFSTLIVV